MIWRGSRPQRKARREFAELVEPCALEVAADAAEGRLSCPALADADGATVALEVRWQPACAD